ncbi:hypothetical protein A4A49_08977 [Nicotiana attenuata]|uniref:Uncharacterized protein n=1 Tax=Nicotiana attenuata TaxID=49451 RepID=A0A1J6J3B7_NICAT|nr:hypothetical protein A4A49_08977 [Nicotiana attenuata]
MTTVTPVTSGMNSFTPLTFGSFLPARFQPIREENELNEEDECNSNQWNSTKEVKEKESQKGKDKLPTSPRRLQFSEAGSSTLPSPDLEQAAAARAGIDKEGHAKELRQQNRNSQMGMKLEYVPPSHRDGKIVIKIMEEDVNMLNEHWATTLIGKSCINGDQSFVVNVCILAMITLSAGKPIIRILKMQNFKFLKEEIGTEEKTVEQEWILKGQQKQGEVIEEQPSNEADMGNLVTAGQEADQNMQMASRHGGSRVQNKPIM